jgi:hypothetical protein
MALDTYIVSIGEGNSLGEACIAAFTEPAVA